MIRWSREAKTRVSQLWFMGKGDEEIARMVSDEYGVTRTVEAVQSLATRLGLPRRDKVGVPLILEAPPPRPTAPGEANVNKEVKATGKFRDCLKCRQKFWSPHAGIFVCDTCKRSDEYHVCDCGLACE